MNIQFAKLFNVIINVMKHAQIIFLRLHSTKRKNVLNFQNNVLCLWDSYFSKQFWNIYEPHLSIFSNPRYVSIVNSWRANAVCLLRQVKQCGWRKYATSKNSAIIFGIEANA